MDPYDNDDFDPYDDDDLDFSDDGFESIDSPNERSTDATEKKADKKSSGVVTGVKHLLELKKTLELDSFKEKKSNRKERKKRQKERKRLQKKGLTGFTFIYIQVHIYIHIFKMTNSQQGLNVGRL